MEEVGMNRSIHTDKAPAAIGPYSQAVQAGNTVYVSGQIPIIPEKGELTEGGIEAQTRQSLTNISNILAAAGYSMKDVVKTTVLLADIADFAAFNAVYEKYFVSKPARSCVAVKDLPKGVLCEIEAVAAVE
jgi:2-iminobutanoate/2-iminopropanoate deaminase